MNSYYLKPATLALLASAVALAGVILVRGAQNVHDIADAASNHAVSQDVGPLRQRGESCFDADDFECAADAYKKAVILAPDDATLWSALGEARVMASPRDPMPRDALAAFRRAIALSPKNPRARYFLVVNKDLAGDHAGAINDWLALLADTPIGAPWEKDLRRTIEQVGRINGIAVTQRLAMVRQPVPTDAPTVPGPSTNDLTAATAIPPSQQRTMADTMVKHLEARLAANPHNAQGWVMLMRSRVTLDQRDLAETALRQALLSDAVDADQIRGAAQQLGLH